LAAAAAAAAADDEHRSTACVRQCMMYAND